ncbi:MAG: AI-2E family transporter [Clostridia bacterium]|nr:AI-2E family transporter [Clostridia bacterium]
MERKKFRDYFLLGAALLVLYFILLNLRSIAVFADNLWRILSPFLLGGALAFVLNVPMKIVETRLLCFMDKIPSAKRFKRALAMLLVLALAILAIYLLMSMIIPELISTLTTVFNAIPGAIRRLDELLEPTGISVSGVLNSTFKLPTTEELSNQLENMVNIALRGVAFSGAVIGTVYTNVLDLFFVIMFIIYFLSGKEKIGAQVKSVMKAYLKDEKVERILKVGSLSQRTFAGFITGQCLEALILGCMCFLGMTLFKMPYVMLVSIFIGVTALLPIVGGWIGCIVGALLILINNPMQALWFILMFLVLQQLEGNIFYPRVMGNAIGLPPIWVLFAVVAGEGLMGLLGMLLFIPLTSVGYTLLREHVHKRLEKKKAQT